MILNLFLLKKILTLVKRIKMKITITITLLFTLFTTCLSAQNSRLFNQLEGLNRSYNTLILNKDGLPYFFSIREDDGVYMKLTYGPIDEETLSPLSYHYVMLPIEKDSFKYLNGAQINGNHLEVMIQKGTTSSLSKINFLEIDLLNNSVLNSYSTEYQYSRGYFRARQVDNKLVSYTYHQSKNRVIRFEKSLSANFTVDTLPGVFNNPAVISTKISELELIDGEEYAVVTTATNGITFIKKDVASYQMSSVPVESQATRGWDFLQYDDASILFVGRTCAIEVDLDFSIIRQNVQTYFPSVNTNVEVLKKDNLLYAYSSDSDYYYKIDDLLNIVEQNSVDRRMNVVDCYTHENSTWIFGTTVDLDGEYLQDNYVLNSIFIIKNPANFSFDEHHRLLKLNDFNINIGNYNRHFLQKKDNTASIFLDGDKSLIFMTSENILGKNTTDELVGVWGRFLSEKNLLSGPVFTSVDDDNMRKDKYNRSYFVTSEMISSHVQNINSATPDYVMPNGIRFWPGNGNTANGEAHKIADFVDLNNNGIYEPHLAEFPKIFGDQCLLTVYHQNSNNLLDNSIEIHRYLFTVNCDTNEVLKNVFFNNTRYINRGADIRDVYVGSFIDYNLGYNADDYAGTNIELGLTYVYNGDSFDETNGTQVGFHDTIPAFGQLVLSGVKLENDGVDNSVGVNIGESINGIGFGDGVEDNEFYTLESSRYYTEWGVFPYNDPATSVGTYFNLQGLYSDGTAVNYNGTPTRYELFGQSDPNFYATRGVTHSNDFTESQIGNPPGNRRMMTGSGSGYLEAGDTLNYLTAYVLSYGDNTNLYSSVDQLFTDAQKVKIFFDGNDLGCGKTFNLSDESLKIDKVGKLDFSVYPNPFGNELFVHHDFKGEVQLSIRSLNGQEVYRQNSISNQEYINVELNAGIYFMELNSPKGRVVKKLVRR